MDMTLEEIRGKVQAQLAEEKFLRPEVRQKLEKSFENLSASKLQKVSASLEKGLAEQRKNELKGSGFSGEKTASKMQTLREQEAAERARELEILEQIEAEIEAIHTDEETFLE